MACDWQPNPELLQRDITLTADFQLVRDTLLCMYQATGSSCIAGSNPTSKLLSSKSLIILDSRFVGISLYVNREKNRPAGALEASEGLDEALAISCQPEQLPRRSLRYAIFEK